LQLHLSNEAKHKAGISVEQQNAAAAVPARLVLLLLLLLLQQLLLSQLACCCNLIKPYYARRLSRLENLIQNART
jgi:hypothetical protein